MALKNTITLTTDVTGILPLANVDAQVSTKAYVDAQTSTVGAGLSKSGTAISVNTDQSAVITKVGTLQGLSVTGDVTISGNAIISTAPTADTHLTNKTYVDTLLSAGTGLTRTGNNFSVNVAQPQITSVGTLSSLNVNGNANFAGDVTVSGNVVVSTVPTLGTHLTNKTYVDTLLSAGTGLTRSGNAFSVNPAQPQITSVGTLSSLNVRSKLLEELVWGKVWWLAAPYS
ncbi:uncharacterized protein EV422DRAFT_567517 [Fimicolochytrium jonesii]|uniref:uncharacterized protein n=1 Tax=Fimicolochytrium jonesii TaxID=1396493 RepID=UPI0022FEFE08|nr:uncharacterized protein EV422DRAFT_567517 [Fimicolochytrium jonesii]KAI8820626.1 hypothetical protein EV422DRAFT_567517 [Fimicolochytrium jonesii]